MYVCVCRAVTDKEVEAAIDGGAHTLEAVARTCEAGGDCGACHAHIEDMIEERACGGRCAGDGTHRHLELLRERAA